MYVNMKELKKHTILGFKIGGVLKTRIVPGMFLSSKITKFLLSVCGSRNTCQFGEMSQLFVVTNHEKDGLPAVRIYEDIFVGARVI